MTAQPKISLLLSVQAGCARRLSATIESVRAQIYPHWELRVMAASGCDPAVREVLGDFARNDTRVSVRFLQAHRIGAVAEDAVRTGSAYVGIVGEGDLLAPRALYGVAAEAVAHPDAALLYTDEDGIDDAGARCTPNFKPDWNPQLLLSQNYLGGLCVFRADAVAAAGSFRNGLDAAGSYDLALRVSETVNARQIRHLPRVLYHRRLPWGGAAPEPADKAPCEAGRQMLKAYLARNGIRGEVLGMPAAGGYRIRYAIPPGMPLVSIIIPTRDGLDLLRHCIESIRKICSYPRYEILVVDNQSRDPAMLAYLDVLAARGDATVLCYDRPFNYPAINNFAARHARGKVFCLLNNDTEVITPGWLEEMLGLLYQKDVGVVGAKLLYPDGTVQHGGDWVGVGGVANHAHAFLRRGDPGYQGRALLAQDMSAVTGACLMVWKSLYEKLGGLDEQHLPVAFNDVDFCLRVREAGYRVVWTPHAELYHRESASRGKDRSPERVRQARYEAAYMRKRWKHMLRHDPFYNPNLSYERPRCPPGNATPAEGSWFA
ncbi:glycosyltransferase family 2 protein [Candidatus Ferrigenium straubiae]|uniref:glycosyltransferase family 2 protein n=1 Tax=Candidatus Ferrigenium straubiae TaxID=2919506 RepID=UPI003F4AC7BB